MLQRIKSAVKLSFWSLSSRMWDEQASTRVYVEPVIEGIRKYAPSRGRSVLDLGCGVGIYSIALAEAGYDVTGVDGAAGMLARAYPRITPALASHLRFERVNVDGNLPYPDDSFDIVIAISVLQALADPGKTCQEIRRVLNPAGIFVVLHLPKPPHLNIPLGSAIRRRIHILKRKNILNVLMAAVKTLGEKYGGTRYWTPAELGVLLEGTGFRVAAISETDAIIAVAQKSV